MVVPTVDNSFFANLAYYAERFLYDEGYAMLQAWNSNLMTDDREEARLYDREKAESVCLEYAREALLDI